VRAFKATAHLILLLAIWKQSANGAHSSVSSLLFSVGNDAMNAPRYWQRRNELLYDFGNDAMNSSEMAALQREWGTSVQPLKKPTQVRDEFHSRVGNLVPDCQQLYEVLQNL
jgi:hypothetical protein